MITLEMQVHPYFEMFLTEGMVNGLNAANAEAFAHNAITFDMLAPNELHHEIEALLLAQANGAILHMQGGTA